MIKSIIKSIFCKHDYQIVRTIHGDMINHLNARSEWKCSKCGWFTYSKHLDKLEKKKNGTTFEK